MTQHHLSEKNEKLLKEHDDSGTQVREHAERQFLNLSALAVREKAITLFLLIAIAAAGVFAFLKLGRAEDPSFTIKVFTVSAVWPGATAQEMQDLVAEPLEKRMQELRTYDRVETFTRPGLALMMVNLKDNTRPQDVPEEFYQARKKLGDEAHKLPQGVFGPFINDEYSDVTFALYSVEAQGLPPRQLAREAETLRQRILQVPGVKKIDIVGERPERIFVEFSYPRLATLGVSARDIFDALVRENAVTPSGSIRKRNRCTFAWMAHSMTCRRFGKRQSWPLGAL
jgi:multidrug efflux pump subunit AcrB